MVVAAKSTKKNKKERSTGVGRLWQLPGDWQTQESHKHADMNIIAAILPLLCLNHAELLGRLLLVALDKLETATLSVDTFPPTACLPVGNDALDDALRGQHVFKQKLLEDSAALCFLVWIGHFLL